MDSDARTGREPLIKRKVHYMRDVRKIHHFAQASQTFEKFFKNTSICSFKAMYNVYQSQYFMIGRIGFGRSRDRFKLPTRVNFEVNHINGIMIEDDTSFSTVLASMYVLLIYFVPVSEPILAAAESLSRKQIQRSRHAGERQVLLNLVTLEQRWG